MRSIINELAKYDVIGFDMDGTLYDEYEFISQAYANVADVISQEKNCSAEAVYNNLCGKWLEYGSSGNIFQLTAKELFSEELSTDIIKKCIEAYRTCDFHLTIPQRTVKILNSVRNLEKELFLVTDGNSALQRRKISQLGLERWFEPGNIAISGDYGSETQKPSPFMFGKIEHIDIHSTNIVYVGDRDNDRRFAENIGASFVKVNIMQQVYE